MNPDNHTDIRDTDDGTDEAQTAPTIPSDISKYESTFKDNKFWQRNTSDEDVKDMLNRSVLGSGEPTGALWDPLIATRKKIIELAKGIVSTLSSLQRFASRGWLSDEINPLGRWLADETLVQRTDDSPRYINADFVWGHIKGMRMACDDEKTLNESILRELRVSQISHVNTVLHDCDYRSPSFFMGNPKFHHNGIDGRQPEKVFLRRLRMYGLLHNVFVYTTGNGSGRTTELAASAPLRDCVISIVTTADKDISSDADFWQRSDECKEKLKVLLDEVIKENPMALRVIINAMNNWMDPRASDGSQGRPKPVRILFCLDDARDFPNLIQGIVDSKENVGDTMGRYIASGCDGKLGEDCKTERRIEVVFSVVGTGQYGDSVGSLPPYYDCLSPSGYTLNKTSSDTSSD